MPRKPSSMRRSASWPRTSSSRTASEASGGSNGGSCNTSWLDTCPRSSARTNRTGSAGSISTDSSGARSTKSSAREAGVLIRVTAPSGSPRPAGPDLARPACRNRQPTGQPTTSTARPRGPAVLKFRCHRVGARACPRRQRLLSPTAYTDGSHVRIRLQRVMGAYARDARDQPGDEAGVRAREA
jgi:hypothetical protein